MAFQNNKIGTSVKSKNSSFVKNFTCFKVPIIGRAGRIRNVSFYLSSYDGDDISPNNIKFPKLTFVGFDNYTF